MKQIESLEDLTPHPTNPNKGTKRGREFVRKSLEDYGAGRSVLADRNGVLIAGNQTAAAANAAGRKRVRVVQTDGEELVVVQRTDLDADDPAARALAVADNRATEIGLEWDKANLEKLDLSLDAFFDAKDLRAIGIKQPEITAPEPQLDRAEELRTKWVTARGQVWEIGRHRLMCGDSTATFDTMKLLNEVRPEMVFTSFPYAVGLKYRGGMTTT